MNTVLDLGPYPNGHPNFSTESRHVLASRFSRGSFSKSQTQIPRVLRRPYVPQDFEITESSLTTPRASNELEGLSRIRTRETVAQQLPPVDYGIDAWKYLFAAFILEALCWGFPFSFGVFQAYYSQNAPFAGNSRLSVVGTLAAGLGYLSNPLICPLIGRFPLYRKHMMYFGLMLCVLSCVIASFAKSINILILSQGAMYGLGAGIMYSPLLSYLSEWFVQRRGLAYGIMFAGTGISGVVLPILFETLLRNYGYETTLRIWAISLFTLAAPCLLLVKGRLPSSHLAPASRRISFAFLKNKLFYVFCTSNMLHGMCYFLPSVYLPSYADDLGLSHIQSTIILSCLNLSSVLGQIMMGQACDKINVHIPLVLSTTLSSMSVFLLWGFSKSFATLIAFSLFYGLTSQFSVLWGQFAMELIKDDVNTQLTIMGLFAAQRGLGNILSGPISSTLLGSRRDNSSEFGIGKYQSLILITGSLLTLASLGGLGACLRKKS